MRFTQEAGIALGATDFGTLMAVKFIGNRNVSTGLLILAFFFMKQHRALGALLLVRGLIDLFNAFWLGMALSTPANAQNLFTLQSRPSLPLGEPDQPYGPLWGDVGRFGWLLEFGWTASNFCREGPDGVGT